MLNAFRRLIEYQQARPRDQGAGDRQLLLAAGEVAVAAMQDVFQHRKQGEDLIRDVVQVWRQRRKAGFEVLKHGEPGKEVAALRNQGQPSAGALMRRQLVQHSVFPGDVAGADRVGPQDCPQQARLADTVASENARHLTLVCGQADAAQRMARAVKKIDSFDG